MCTHTSKKLDFEDEPPDDKESASEESEDEEREEKDSDADSDSDQFADALEDLTLTELSPVVVAAAS